MEVHHTHTPRQKWTHYFWEFLMLFLAITLGFFVENQREHLIEHRRAWEYSKSLFGDLRADTAELLAGDKEIKFIIRSIDNLISLAPIPLDF